MNIRIRHAKPSDAAAIARVHVDSWRSTYAGIVPQGYLSGLSYTGRQSVWEESLRTSSPRKSHFLAETENGEAIGFVVAGPESEGNLEYRGEIYAIYLLEVYQRQGVGHRLFLASCRSLRDAGMGSMLLWVLEDNHGARRFYESLGGENTNRSAVIKIAGSDLVEIAYGWTDIAPLVR